MVLSFLRNVIIFVSLSLPSFVLAHGDAAWIMNNPDYKRRTGIAHCCNPTDCGLVPEDIVTRNFRDNGKTIEIWHNGKLVDSFDKTKLGIYKSKDEKWWWCRSVWAARDEQVKYIHCLFYPVSVM